VADNYLPAWVGYLLVAGGLVAIVGLALHWGIL
jgi:hypothetical protein